MKLTKVLFAATLLVSAFLVGCADEKEEYFDKFEGMSLRAWMTQHHPELLENYHVDGDYGFYFDILNLGETSTSSPIANEDMWVRFDLSARDLNGNIVLTRDAHEAKLLNTFTKNTRYIPYYRFCGKGNSEFLEGAYLAMRSKLHMGDQYYDRYKALRGFTSQDVNLREGSKVVLYLPSVMIGADGIEGSGGYEGQANLTANRPVRLEMTICDTVKNPLEEEGTIIDAFCMKNGGLEIYNKEKNPIPKDSLSEKHPLNPASARWVSASDTIAHVYVNHRFDPKTDLMNFPNRYNVGFAPYNDLDLDKKISEALVNRFHKDKPYVGVNQLAADSVTMDGNSKIWYIGRFTDGFIFDTNIDEVKELIYDKGYAEGAALDYMPSSGSLIKAFYYSVPNLRYGQWASFITISTQAYGAAGKQGSTTTSTSGGSSNYDYFNYLNYVNNYYNGYYGGYYDNYYGGMGGYYGGYYDNYYGGMGGYGGMMGNQTPTVTTTTVTTEIPSFEPLIFEIYIEPKASQN